MSRRSRLLSAFAALTAALALVPAASADGLPAGGVPVGDTITFAGGGIVMGFADSPLIYDDCTAGRFCLWDNQGYSGAWIYRTDPGWYDLTSFDNRAESARDNSSYDGKVATGYGGAGSQQCHNAGGHYQSLGSVFNNAVSSWTFKISC